MRPVVTPRAVFASHNAHKRDQASWLRDNSTLFAEETDLVGEVRGRRVLHILCNSGQDTVSWAKRGADVTGVDLSDDAIAFATQLSIDSGIAARFMLKRDNGQNAQGRVPRFPPHRVGTQMASNEETAAG